MNIIDACIILFLLLGCIIGFKKGFIKSLVSLIGTIVVIILAYKIKTPIASVMIKYLPFFDFSGVFEGLKVLNVLVYEGIAFILVFVLLSCILGIIINISGIIEKILNATIILGIFSKILGAIAGLLEMLSFIFVAVFLLSQFNVTSGLVLESKIGSVILNQTPILSDVCAPTIETIKDLYESAKEATPEEKPQLNVEILRRLGLNKIINQADINAIKDGNKLGIGSFEIMIMNNK